MGIINTTIETIKSAISGRSAFFSVDNVKAKTYLAPTVQTNGFSVAGNLINLNIQIYVAHKSNMILHDLVEEILNICNGVIIGNQRLEINSGEIFKDTDLFTCVLTGNIQIPNVPEQMIALVMLGEGTMTFNENCEA